MSSESVVSPTVLLGPSGRVPPWAIEAVNDGGGSVVEDPSSARAMVWMDVTAVQELRDALFAGHGVEWVQLPWAGVEAFSAAGIFSAYPDVRFTCGKGVYAEPVAEHALALGLAGLRDLPGRARSTAWGKQSGVSLFDASVVIVGGGGIAEVLIDLLAPLRARVTIVRRDASIPVGSMAGVVSVVGPEHLLDVLPGADLVVLALALTPETDGLFGARELAAMAPHAWLVNVARGRHVDTDALVRALQERRIGGAALDVTEPEPLPDGHPLWLLPNAIITPHTANTLEMARPHLARRIRENVARFAAGEDLIGPVDPALGY